AQRLASEPAKRARVYDICFIAALPLYGCVLAWGIDAQGPFPKIADAVATDAHGVGVHGDCRQLLHRPFAHESFWRSRCTPAVADGRDRGDVGGFVRLWDESQ